MKQCFSDLPFVSFDSLTLKEMAAHDPEGFIRQHPEGVLIDEVQTVPALFLAIKNAVDDDRKAGRFILTGSSNFFVSSDVSDSLAGRMEVFSLYPLATQEIQGVQFPWIDQILEVGPRALFQGRPLKYGREDILECIQWSGYPEVLKRQAAKRRKRWYESYIRMILERDIRDVTKVFEVGDLYRLFQILANRSVQLVNQANLSRTLQSHRQL